MARLSGPVPRPWREGATDSGKAGGPLRLQAGAKTPDVGGLVSQSRFDFHGWGMIEAAHTVTAFAWIATGSQICPASGRTR